MLALRGCQRGAFAVIYAGDGSHHSVVVDLGYGVEFVVVAIS
jgi:hypothetical protein